MPLSLAANALVTPAAVYDELGLTLPNDGPSDRIVRAINAMSQRVESSLKRKLRRRVFTVESPEQLQGTGGMWLFLSRWPIESVESILVDDQDWTFGRSEDGDDKGYLQSAPGWPRRQGRDPLTGRPGGVRAFNVAAAYTGGYKLPNDSGPGIELPGDLQQLVLDEIVLAYRTPRHFVESEKTPGGWSRSYSKTGADAKKGFSKEAESVLRDYRRKVTGHV